MPRKQNSAAAVYLIVGGIWFGFTIMAITASFGA
jgi:hypothetical protein